MIRNVLLLLGGCIFTLQAYAAPVPESEQPFYAESELQSELPVGNYLLICKNCEVDDDNQLSCSCPESLPAEQIASGEPVEPTYNPQTVDLTRCDSGRVVYLDGYIFCDNADEDAIESVRGTENDSPVTDSGEPVPEPENVVYQLEDDRSATEEETFQSVDLSEPEFDAFEAGAGNLPVGDYIRYCQPCRVEDGRLVCECETDSYFSTVKASISLDSCSKDDTVTYYRGSLMCQSDFNRMSRYFGGCSDCKVDGNTVECVCKKTPCQWSIEDLNKGRRNVVAKLEEFRFCSSNIVNCNGQLRCGGCGLFDYHEEYSRPYEGEVAAEYCHHVSEGWHSVEDFFLLRWLRN